jgi:hypothetical protein
MGRDRTHRLTINLLDIRRPTEGRSHGCRAGSLSVFQLGLDALVGKGS